MPKNPSLLPVVMVACLGWFASNAAGQQDLSKGASQAKEVAEQFMKAMIAEDIDAVMAVVDVPFFLDGKKTVEDRDELKSVFMQVFEEKELGGTHYKTEEVQTVAEWMEKRVENERRLLEEVAGKDDFVARVSIKDKDDTVSVIVRGPADQGKVVGIRD